ncbi:MAG: alpha/beta fold hydrolase [Candidatus Hydrogenedentota bacterium]
MAVRGAVASIEEPQGVGIAFWREAFSALDYLKMKASPVYYGFNVPHGNGEPVILVPGFLGCDFYLLELYLWLRRIGYRAYMSHIGQNAECPDLLIHRLMGTVNRVHAKNGQRIHLVGHSLGGVLARGIAARRPDRIASVIMLAAPFRGVRVSPWVHRTIEHVRKRIHGRRCRGKQCFTTTCACGFSCTMRYAFPQNIPQTAVYTKNDGVVDWPVCINNDPETDVEVTGSHIGLVWNAQAYRVIAHRLDAACEHQRKAAQAATDARAQKRKSKIKRKAADKQAPAGKKAATTPRRKKTTQDTATKPTAGKGPAHKAHRKTGADVLPKPPTAHSGTARNAHNLPHTAPENDTPSDTAGTTRTRH